MGFTPWVWKIIVFDYWENSLWISTFKCLIAWYVTVDSSHMRTMVLEYESQHLPEPKSPSFVSKYTSTMEQMGQTLVFQESLLLINSSFLIGTYIIDESCAIHGPTSSIFGYDCQGCKEIKQEQSAKGLFTKNNAIFLVFFVLLLLTIINHLFGNSLYQKMFKQHQTV